MKLIKSNIKKVQISIQGDELRVSSNKRDDLQNTISLIKQNIQNQPLQFVNFRD